MAVKRRVPRVRDLAPLIRFKQAPSSTATKRRLDAALTIEDLRRIAKRRTPKAAFDYTDGAAEDELSHRSAPDKPFATSSFTRRSCATSATSATGWEVLGQPVALPFGIAPTGLHPIDAHRGRDRRRPGGGRRPGSRSRCPPWAPPRSRTWRPLFRRAANGFSCTCGATGTARWRWCERAADAGFDTLLVTVDVPVAGARLRDVRNGMSIPPALTLRTVLDARAAPALVVRPVDHRAAGVRVAGSLVGHRRRVPGHHVRPQRHLRRPGLDQGRSGRASSS